MSTSWSTLLAELGAQLSERGDSVFADTDTTFATLDERAVIMPLPHYGVLSIQGVDSAKFLQGQLTCDVLEVNTKLSTPGAYCTQKGRMLTSFQLAQPDADHYLLRMRSDVVENSARTLTKYIVFSKAKLTARDDIVVFGLHGVGTGALLQTMFGALPQRINGTVAGDNGLLLQRDEAGHWFECWLPIANATAFWQHCRAHCDAAGSAYWRQLTIRAELGEVSAATTELFIPQMLNYHLNGAVSFKKGCYTGQEIVARTHYRGHVKRHLQRATSTGTAPIAGSEVGDANGRAIGNVVDSVIGDQDQVELLVVINDAELANGTIKLATGEAVIRPAPASGQ